LVLVFGLARAVILIFLFYGHDWLLNFSSTFLFVVFVELFSVRFSSRNGLNWLKRRVFISYLPSGEEMRAIDFKNLFLRKKLPKGKP